MAELFVRDIFDEYAAEIEADFKKIKEISCGLGFMESQLFVGSLQRISRKIYMRYGQRIVSYEDARNAEYIIYQQLLRCTKDLQIKYFGNSVG